MKPTVLILNDMSPGRIARFSESYTVLYAESVADRLALLDRHAAAIDAVVTNGSRGLTAVQIARLPRLGIICCQGAGHENVDCPAALARNITVTHGPGTNASSVADHALALLFAIVRDIPRADQQVRAGAWDGARAVRGDIFGKRMGILGLGRIGTLIARRAAGFDMQICYHNRKPNPGVPYRYAASPHDLAEASDFLMVAAPGGAASLHIVDAEVLRALGPGGYVVNVGRGSVIHTDALIAALQQRRIAGAALDVLEEEPDVPADLIALPNVILTPHIAGRSPSSVQATLSLMLRNLAAHFAGQPVLTPVSAPAQP